MESSVWYIAVLLTHILQEMIYKEACLKKVLRLLCIQSIAADGLKPKLLEFYKREIVQSYGYHHLITFDRYTTLLLLITAIILY